MHESSYYSINRLLFRKQDEGDYVINKMFSSYKSGVINLELDQDWKKKIDMYLAYANEYRENAKGWFVIKDKKEK